MNFFQQPAQNSNANQASGAAPGGNTLGAPPANGASTGSGSTTNIFGGSTFGATPASGGLFGGSPSGSSGAFGAAGNPSTPTSGGGLFGSSNTATAPAGNLFGNSSNTSVPGSGSSPFGGGSTTAPTGGGSIFGTTNSTPSNSAPLASGGNLFGNINTSSTTPAAGGIFGNTNTAPSTAGGGIFGNFGASTAPATGGGLFGGKTQSPASGEPSGSNPTAPTGANTSTPSATQPSSSIFGAGAAGGSSFFATKPADQAGTAGAKPATPTLFGQPITSNTSSSNPATGSGGGIFGSVPRPSDASTTANSTPTPAAAGGLFGGNLFGAKPSTPAASTNTNSAPAPPTLPAFSLGGNAANKDAGKDASASNNAGTSGAPPNFFAKKPEEKKDAPAASTTLPTFDLFGNKDKGKEKEKDNAAASGEKKGNASVPLPTFSMPSTTASKESEKPKDAPSAAPGASAPSAPGTSGPSIAVPPPSMLRGKTIEEIVNRWSNDLETHVREFSKFAGEIAVWDRALIENGNNLAALYAHVLAAEQEQNDIDQSLDHIEQQQKDLAVTLEAYEKSTEEILGGQGSNLRALDAGPADSERDKNYMLATELHGHLDDLSGSLTQMIDVVNALALPSEGASQDKGDDAMGQIAQILNSHLESLLWIDGAAQEVESKINDVEKRVRLAGESGVGAGSKTKGFGTGGHR